MGVTGREEKLSWEARAEEVGFEVLPKRCNRGSVSYMKGEIVPKDRGIVTEGIRKVFISTTCRSINIFLLVNYLHLNNSIILLLHHFRRFNFFL